MTPAPGVYLENNKILGRVLAHMRVPSHTTHSLSPTFHELEGSHALVTRLLQSPEGPTLRVTPRLP